MEEHLTSSVPPSESSVTQRYRLLSKIGAGGMGDVYLGIQKGAVDFQRLIVLKRIHGHLLGDAEQSQMFVDEASLVANLNHPNIVKIIDFRQTNNTFYIVMEYVDGETLKVIRGVCNQKGLQIPFPLACKLVLSACDALNYAHNVTSHDGIPLNIIHRDIGLHNLMIDRNGYLKVIDFGIAKSSIQTGMTSPDLIKGNPGYMAPDIFGYNTIDHRVDIYALGLSLFELLTTERAFKFTKNTPLAEVIQRVSREPLPKASSIVPSIPKTLDTIIQKATVKDRDIRYQTVAELAEDLQAFARKHYSTFEGCTPKAWFNEHFRKQFDRRIQFEKDVLSLAKEKPSKGINSYLPPPRHTMNSNELSISYGSAPSWTKSNSLGKRGLFWGVGTAFIIVLLIGLFVLIRDPSPAPKQTNPEQSKSAATDTPNTNVNTPQVGAEIKIEQKPVPPIQNAVVKASQESTIIKAEAAASAPSPSPETSVKKGKTAATVNASGKSHKRKAPPEPRPNKELPSLQSVGAEQPKSPPPLKQNVPLLDKRKTKRIPLLDKPASQNVPLL